MILVSFKTQPDLGIWQIHHTDRHAKIVWIVPHTDVPEGLTTLATTCGMIGVNRSVIQQHRPPQTERLF